MAPIISKAESKYSLETIIYNNLIFFINSVLLLLSFHKINSRSKNITLFATFYSSI